MSFKTALRSRVKANATVTAQSARVDWNARPQGSTLPAVVLQTIAEQHDQHMAAVMGTQSSRVQATVFAATAAQADLIGAGVRDAMISTGTTEGLTFQRGFINLIRDGVDNTSTGNVFHLIVDATIWFN